MACLRLPIEADGRRRRLGLSTARSSGSPALLARVAMRYHRKVALPHPSQAHAMTRQPAVCFLYPPFYWAELDSKILLLRAWAESRGIPTAEIIRRDDQSLSDLARKFAEMPSVE